MGGGWDWRHWVRLALRILSHNGGARTEDLVEDVEHDHFP